MSEHPAGRFVVEPVPDGFGWQVRDTETDEVIGDDFCDPKDALLVRDFSWVVDALNRVHVDSLRQGRAEAFREAVAILRANASAMTDTPRIALSAFADHIEEYAKKNP